MNDAEKLAIRKLAMTYAQVLGHDADTIIIEAKKIEAYLLEAV